MENILLPFIMFCMIAFVGIAIYLGQKVTAHHRSTDMRKFARASGMTYLEQGNPEKINTLKSLFIGSQGDNIEVTNLIQGEIQGVPVEIFDFKFFPSVGLDTSRYQSTVVEFPAPPLMPAFTIRRKRLFEQTLRALDGDSPLKVPNLDGLETNLEVYGEAVELIEPYITADLMRALDRIIELTVESDGERIYFSIYPHGVEDIDKMPQFVSLVYKIHTHFFSGEMTESEVKPFALTKGTGKIRFSRPLAHSG